MTQRLAAMGQRSKSTGAPLTAAAPANVRSIATPWRFVQRPFSNPSVSTSTELFSTHAVRNAARRSSGVAPGNSRSGAVSIVAANVGPSMRNSESPGGSDPDEFGMRMGACRSQTKGFVEAIAISTPG